MSDAELQKEFDALMKDLTSMLKEVETESKEHASKTEANNAIKKDTKKVIENKVKTKSPSKK